MCPRARYLQQNICKVVLRQSEAIWPSTLYADVECKDYHHDVNLTSCIYRPPIKDDFRPACRNWRQIFAQDWQEIVNSRATTMDYLLLRGQVHAFILRHFSPFSNTDEAYSTATHRRSELYQTATAHVSTPAALYRILALPRRPHMRARRTSYNQRQSHRPTHLHMP